ncbi:MAG: PQQ-like beta-propeller repeat protein [Fuerstiella sp.]|nr:PQQ-like beta-propeller repeat protein [Fuerstiella sp.]
MHSNLHVSIRVFKLLFCTCVCMTAFGAESGWPSRFGPHGNSNVPLHEAAGIPSSWDEETGKNISWKIDLPEFGHSTPVVLNGLIWLTSASEDGHRQYLDCIDSVTGHQLHHKLLFENEDPEPLNNPVNTYASPSCVVNDEAVYVHFGSYGTARVNPESLKVIWQRRNIECRHYRGPGSSPVLHRNLLILTFDGVDTQFLTALDTDTGKTVWYTPRSTDYGDLDENGEPSRDGDIRKAYSTPGLVDVNGRTQLISVGSRAAFAYDADTGEEIWTIRHDDFNAAAPPVFFRNLAILNTGSSGANLIGIDLNSSTQGDITESSHVVWDRDRGNSRMASPLLFDGRVFMVTHRGVAVCVEAATGNELNKVRLGGTFISSPIVANGLIYVGNDEGTVIVFRADSSLEIIARNKMTEGMRSSPAVADGRLFLRTMTHLFCIGPSQ